MRFKRLRLFLITFISASMLLGTCGPTWADRYALIIGSAAFDPAAWLSYGAVPPALHGVETDAHLMAELASAPLGFPRKNIRIVGCPDSGFRAAGYSYLGENATYGLVTREMRRLVHLAKSGDYCLLYYSGHGCKLGDQTRLSRETEFLVLRDGPLFNFEIYSLLAKIKAHTTLVFDCCYSGGAARAAGVPLATFGQSKTLTLLRDDRVRAVMEHRKRAYSILPGSTQNLSGELVLLAACTRNQEAIEARIPGYDNSPECRTGIFTLALYRAFFQRRGVLTYQGLRDETQRLLQNWNMGQTPTLNGERSEAPALAPPVIPAPFLPVTGKMLAGGVLADARPGTQFRSPNGTVYRVATTGLFDARIEPLRRGAGWPRLVAPYRRSLIASVVPGFRSASRKNLGVEPGDDSALNDGILVTVAEGTHGTYVVSAHSLLGITGPLAVCATRSEAEAKASQIAASLRAAWKLEHLLDSIGAGSVHPLGLELSADRGTIAAEYSVGETIELRVASQHPGYLLLLAAEPDGSLSVLWPNREEESVFLDAPRQLRIQALAPAGLTRVTALLTTRPLRLPTGLLGTLPAGLVSYTISPDQTEAFLRWLQESLDCRTGADEVGSVSAPLFPPSAPLFSPADVEEYSMNILVH